MDKNGVIISGSEFKPERALIIHGQDSNYERKYYIENCQIRKSKDGYKIGAGKPLSTSFMRKLMEALITGESGNPFSVNMNLTMDRLMLSMSATPASINVTWFLPASVQYLYFTEGLGIPNGNAHLPGIVFHVKNERLSLFVVKNKSITLKTKLYTAPFHNTSSGVCMGSVKVPKWNGNMNEYLVSWEKAFFGSVFTSIHGSNPIKGNLNLMYKHLIETGEKFPLNLLVPSKIKIDKLCTT